MSAAARPSWPTAVVALLAPPGLAAAAAALAQPALIQILANKQLDPWVLATSFGSLAFATFSLLSGFASQRRPAGAPGRLRGSLLGHACALSFAGLGALLLVLRAAGPRLPRDTTMTLEDALLLFPTSVRAALLAAAVTSGAGAVVALFADIGLWWLVPIKIRRALFALIDLGLLAGASVLWWPVLAHPRFDEAVITQAIRLGLTFLLGVRLLTRALPWVLDRIESVDFRSLVAARHLRAKKSGFLAAISFLSILAVSVSSCALTTTLSVMGGFRQDLKRKILGNNAHIVIDRPDGQLDAHTELLAKTRRTPLVRGVSPYVSGEVMISSASNLAGAVLRGIDVAHIGEVSELPKSITMGSLDYLSRPEKLSHLPASQLGLGVSTPKVTRAGDESDLPARKGSPERLSEAIEEAADEIEQASAGRARGPATTLPGVIVGQELARSLRLYLGDEVNVVTPLGELGPTGPMPKSRPFRVAGIFYSGMYEYDMKFAYVTLSAAQKFLGRGERVSGIEVTVKDPDRAQDVANALARELGVSGLRVRPWQELNKNLFGALALEKLAMFIALGIAILVASFCIVGTLTLMVQEKGREVAVLKAMGAADRAIVGIFVLEGALIGVFGALLGLAMGYVMCFAAEHFGVRLNPEVYYIDRVPVHIDPSEFVTVGLAAVAVCLLVTIFPAKLASRLRPVEALRYE